MAVNTRLVAGGICWSAIFTVAWAVLIAQTVQQQRLDNGWLINETCVVENATFLQQDDIYARVDWCITSPAYGYTQCAPYSDWSTAVDAQRAAWRALLPTREELPFYAGWSTCTIPEFGVTNTWNVSGSCTDRGMTTTANNLAKQICEFGTQHSIDWVLLSGISNSSRKCGGNSSSSLPTVACAYSTASPNTTLTTTLPPNVPSSRYASLVAFTVLCTFLGVVPGLSLLGYALYWACCLQAGHVRRDDAYRAYVDRSSGV